MAKHAGEEIREVWDFRLSRACPMLYNSGDTWVVKIHCNKTGELLDEHDSGMPTVVDGVRNNHDCAAIAKCYDWLRSVRDDYERDNIGLRKPVVAMINEANAIACQLTAEIVSADEAGDTNLANQKRGELMQHQKAATKSIASATDEMHKMIAGGV